jgi:hypothetical protein
MKLVRMRNARVRRLWAWLAIAALLFGSLAPAFAHAYGADGAGLTEICTVDGVRYIDAAGRILPPDGSVHLERMRHCAFCSAHHPWVGLLPGIDPSPGVFSDAATPSPRRFLAGPRPLFPWVSANPRAPPVARA